jgi:hypothetical protein
MFNTNPAYLPDYWKELYCAGFKEFCTAAVPVGTFHYCPAGYVPGTFSDG